VLDDGAVDDVFERGLGGGLGRSFGDEGFEDFVLVGFERLDW